MRVESRWGWFADYPAGTCGDGGVADACRRGATVRILSNDGTTALVEYKGSTGIVSSRDLLGRPAPEFAWGGAVTVPSKGTEARVTDVCWYYSERRYYYHLEDTDGRPIKRRYFGDELRRASGAIQEVVGGGQVGKRDATDLTTGPVARTLASFSLPFMVGMLLTS